MIHRAAVDFETHLAFAAATTSGRVLRLALRWPATGPRNFEDFTEDGQQRIDGLNTLLRKAVEWDVIDAMPCSIKLLPLSKRSSGFYGFEDYERLVEGARSIDRRTHVTVLLGGNAGLRCGEMIALEWNDVDLKQRRMTIRRSAWNGQVTLPKGGRERHLPLTRV